MLESAEYQDNTFATLTFDEEHLPEDESVDPKHVRKFLRTLERHSGSDRPIRYYAVGEYGGKYGRPHYHVALFDFATCYRGETDLRRKHCCVRCELVKGAWKNGSIHLGRLEPHSAAYLGGYITKRAVDEGDPRLQGRHPEFARMSNRPGLGAGSAHYIASTILEHNIPFVPRSILHGKTEWPLGRYIREKVSEYTEKPVAPAEVAKEMTQLFESVISDDGVRGAQKWWKVREKMVEAARHKAGKALLIEQRRIRKREAQQIFSVPYQSSVNDDGEFSPDRINGSTPW